MSRQPATTQTAQQTKPATPPAPKTQAHSEGNPTASAAPFSITLTPCRMLADRIVPTGDDPVVCDTRGFAAILTLRPGRDLLQQLGMGRFLVVLGTPAQAIVLADRVGLRSIAKKNPGLERRIKSYWKIEQLHRGGTVCEA